MKGLDFALLNKVRAELNKQKKVEEVQPLGPHVSRGCLKNVEELEFMWLCSYYGLWQNHELHLGDYGKKLSYMQFMWVVVMT